MRTISKITVNGLLRGAALWCVFLAFYPPSAAPQTMTTEYVRAGSSLVAVLHKPPAFFGDFAGTQWAQYNDEANMLKTYGITNGCYASPPQYCPSQALLRESAAVFIIRAIYVALNGPGQGSNFTYSPTPHFTDVPNTDPNFPFVQKMFELNITSGCTSTTYCPNLNTTNYAMAVFSWRARQVVVNGAVNNSFTYPTTPQYFNDVPSSDMYFKYIQEAAVLQAVNPATGGSGCTANNFCENNSIYRGDAIPYLTRMIMNDFSF
jgi:hypothetical protein